MACGTGFLGCRCNKTGTFDDSVVVRGGPEADTELRGLFGAEWLRLVRLGFLLTGSRETAEDIVQVAFAQLLARWESIDEPLAYAKRVVINQARESHRRAYRRPRPVADPVVTSIPEVDETWPLIAALPVNQRAVVVLRYYEDLAMTEIAELLGRPPSTVRSDLRRGLARLRKELT